MQALTRCVGGSDRNRNEARGEKRDVKIDMVNEHISAIPLSIPHPERSCLFHFTTSIENGQASFLTAKSERGRVEKQIRKSRSETAYIRIV